MAAPGPAQSAENVRPAVLDSVGARALTERIRQAAGELWSLLAEAHDREAWRALGYASFKAYVEGEFSMHRVTAYRLIDQARVVAALAEASGVAHALHVSQREARDLKPHLDEVADSVRDAIAEVEGDVPEQRVSEIVRDVVDRERARVNGREIQRKPSAVRAAEIQSLATDGASSPQIARELGISEERVRAIVAEHEITIPGDAATRKTRRLDPNHVMERTVAELCESVDTTIGLLQGRWSDLDPDRVEEWCASLTGAIRSVNRLIKELSHVTA